MWALQKIHPGATACHIRPDQEDPMLLLAFGLLAFTVVLILLQAIQVVRHL